MSIKRSKSQFEDKKWLNDIEKLNFNQKSKLINFSIFSITFDIVSIDFELLMKSGSDLIDLVAMIR